MGRKGKEGPKNLARVIDNPRFTRVFFNNGTTKLSFMVAMGSRDRIVAGFEKRGFKAESE